MHEWAAVNGWSRPEAKSEYGRFSVNIPIISNLPKSGFARYSQSSTSPLPKSELTRCHTTMLGQATFMEKQQVYKPREEFGESCTVKYIRYLEVANKDTQTRIRNPSNPFGLQRCQSNLDSRDGPSLDGQALKGTGLFRGMTDLDKFRSPFGLGIPKSDNGGSRLPSNKQEMKIGVAKLPRKGLISLSTTNQPHPQERQFQTLQIGSVNLQPTVQSLPPPQKAKTLIKRSDILGHIRAGSKILHDVEEQKKKDEEMVQSLGDYTIIDLQSKILEMTDTKSLSRLQAEQSLANKKAQKKSRPVALPSINTVKPFSMKS